MRERQSTMAVRLLVLVSLLVVALVGAPRAGAVIALPITVEKTFAESPTVLVGKVASVKADARAQVVVAEVAAALKGAAPASGKVRLMIQKPGLRLAEGGEGGPLAFFAGTATFTIHVGDRWLYATAHQDAPDTYIVYGEGKPDLRMAFPGRTAKLVALLEQQKAGGKLDFLNALDDRMFRGGVKAVGKLEGAERAVAMVAADLDGDKVPELVVSAPDALRVYKRGAGGGAFADATEAFGLAGVRGVPEGVLAAADVNGDGRPDLLAGQHLFIHDGAKLAKLPQPLTVPLPHLASGLADANGDGRPDVCFVRADGTFVAYANPGKAGEPWRPLAAASLWKEADGPALAAVIGPFADDGGAAVLVARADELVRYAIAAGAAQGAAGAGAARVDDFQRLAGVPLDELITTDDGRLRRPAMVAVDAHPDGRPDVLLTAEAFAVALFNRGHGAFFASLPATQPLRPAEGQAALPFKLPLPTTVTTADVSGDGRPELLVLQPDGTLLAVENPPQK